MDLQKCWDDLEDRYSDVKAKIVDRLKRLDADSDEYSKAMKQLSEIETIQSRELSEAAKVADHELKEKELKLKEIEVETKVVEQELEAAKPAIGARDILNAAVPVGCTVLVLVFEMVGNGVITSKSVPKIPFFPSK